jgi:hypothetical protein
MCLAVAAETTRMRAIRSWVSPQSSYQEKRASLAIGQDREVGSSRFKRWPLEVFLEASAAGWDLRAGRASNGHGAR